MKQSRIILFITFISLSFTSQSIAGEPQLEVDHDQLKANMEKLDSQIQELNTSLEEGTEKIRQENFERDMQQNRINLDAFMAKQKETERKRNRWNVIRLVLLAVMIVAAFMSRSMRKKAKELLQAEAKSKEDQSE